MAAASEPQEESEYQTVSRDSVPASELRSGSWDEQITTIQKWLQPTDYSSPGNEFMKHLHSYVPGTGAWMRKSPIFSAWAQSIPLGEAQRFGDTLHIRGVAGSGKSVFAASTICQLQEAEPQAPVLFFFFRQIVEKNHSAKYLVRDFASQLLPHSPNLVSSLHDLSKTRGVNGTELGPLWDAVSQALESMRKVYCVADALDEMDDEDFSFVDQLLHLGARDPGRVKLLVTSRPIPKLEEALRDSQILRLKLEPSLIYPDVATYVNVRLLSLSSTLRPEMEERVKQTICERAQGLFLHARLMTDNLTEGLVNGYISEETLPDSLERLPRSLKDVYDEMLKEHARRSGVDREQQVQILICVTHSSRPLRLIELGSLIASSGATGSLKEGKSLVRASCGRLLEILEDETVSVIHHSFTEFLRDKSRLNRPSSFLVLDAQDAHGMLAVLSLQYLDGCPLLNTNSDSPGDEQYDLYDDPADSRQEMKRREQVIQDMQLVYPLLTYTVENLTYHIKNSKPKDEKVLNAVAALLVPGKPAFGVWMYYKWQSRLCNTFSAMHLAAVAGMPLYIIEHLISSDTDTRDGDGRTPLSYAAEEGYTEAAEPFLEHGADPMSDDRVGYTPLHYAALKGHSGIVNLLLKAGVSPLVGTTRPNPYNVEHFYDNSCGKTPLEFACSNGHTDVITSFIPLISPDDANRCLHWVSGAKNLEAILKTGHANVDCFAGGKTRLFKAAGRHDLEAIQILLQYGADPNIRCSGDRFTNDSTITLEIESPRGPMPIHAFAGCDRRIRLFGHDDEKLEDSKKCLRLLLDSGTSVDATADGECIGHNRDDGNFTPLFYAVIKASDSGFHWGSLDETEQNLASILLAAGANPNAKSTQGNTPLHYANSERLALLDILVANSANVNAKNNLGKTPLLELMRQYDTKPDIKVFEKLIECGADVNVSDKNGNAVFHHVVSYLEKFQSTDLPFLKRVLRLEADLNKKNNEGRPPFMMYKPSSSWESRKSDDEPLLQALVDAGMDINARSSNGKNLLWEYVESWNARIETAEKLIRLGADFTVRAEDGSTLLQHAIKSQRSIEWVRFLASKGIDPSVRDGEGSTLIHLAIRSFSDSSDSNNTHAGRAVIDSLLDLGVSPTEKDGLGRTALHLASLSPATWNHSRNNTRNDDQHWVDVVLKDSVFGTENVNVRDSNGATALHYAASTSEFHVAKLLRAGADPTILTFEGVSPLHVACRARQPNVVGLLLATYKQLGKLEQLVNLCDVIGLQRTSLHIAARSGVPESVICLLAHGADVMSVDQTGCTPLHTLAEFPLEEALWDTKRVVVAQCTGMVKLDDETRPDRGRWFDHETNESETLELLLRAEADADAKAVVEQRDATPLDLALKYHCRSVVQGLLQHGTKAQGESKQLVEDDKISETVRTILEVKDSDQVVENIVEALKKKEYNTIKEFVQQGGNVMAMGAYRNDAILHKMVELGCTSLLEYCNSEASQVDQQHWMEEENNAGTLLAKACERHLPSLHIIKCLVEKIGLDVSAPSDRRGYTYKMAEATPLHFMACGLHFWHVEAVIYLLSRGADIEAKNAYGQTPLLCAISTKQPNGFWKEETIRILLEHGADPNVVDKVGLSCLEAADDARVLRLLLRHGADITAVPGIIACVVDGMDAAMVQVLIDAGADPNQRAKTLFVEINDEDDETNEDDGKDDEDGVGDEKSESGAEEEESKSEKTPLRAVEQPRYPLHIAARPSTNQRNPLDWDSRRQQVTEVLLKHGANPYACYADGSYVLQTVVEEQGLLAPFLELENLDIEKRGRHERTLLLSACFPAKKPHPRIWSHDGEEKFPATTNTEVILALLEREAATNVVDDQGRTPLHCLCTMFHPYDENHQNAFAALVARDVSLIQTIDNAGFKPLHRALQSSQTWAVQHLVARGADLKEADPDGNTALHFLAPKMIGEKTVAKTTQAEFRRLIRESGLDINARNNKGETPLFLCIAAEWTGTRAPGESHPKYALANDVTPSDVLGLFVDLEADLFTVDSEGRTLLHAAAGRRIEDPASNRDQVLHVEGVFKALMRLGLDPRKEDALMRTPVDVAVARGRRGIVELFAEKR